MSKYSIKKLWNEFFGTKDEVFDYAGRRMLKSACGNSNSAYQPTIDHIRPISDGGKDTKANIVICHYSTNAEKANSFPHWKANGFRFHARRVKGLTNGYEIIEERKL
ncbi:MAG: HNH endonuclease [Clostridia bacterium]|nr:HNH endonuclease [Clostridia bacterium]